MSISARDTLVSFGGNAVQVLSDHPVITETLQIHFRHCNSQPAEIVAIFQIMGISETKFTVAVDNTELFSNLGLEQVFWMVMNEIITRLNAACVRGLVLHAAALANAEDAVIFCGKSGSGKSSLAAWLTADGFSYLTDEVIEIPLEGNLVNGLTRSIVLKPASAFIWERHLADKESKGFLSFKNGGAWIDPLLFHPNAAISTAMPRVLVFPHYSPVVSLETKKLTTAETLFRLMQTLVNARNLPGYGMEAATQLARQVEAFDLSYSDIEEASDWIKQSIIP